MKPLGQFYMEYPGGEWNDNMAKHFEDNMAALPIYDLNL